MDTVGVKRFNSRRNHGSFEVSLLVEQTDNGTIITSVLPSKLQQTDDLGALFYVVVIIFLYACSILMMIASYIRKNKEDRRVKRYLKQLAFVRKRELHLSVMSAANKARRHAIVAELQPTAITSLSSIPHPPPSSGQHTTTCSDVIVTSSNNDEPFHCDHATNGSMTSPPSTDIDTRHCHVTRTFVT